MSSRSRRRVRSLAVLASILAVIALLVVVVFLKDHAAAPISTKPASDPTPKTYASLGATVGQAPSGTANGTLIGGPPPTNVQGTGLSGGPEKHTLVFHVWADTSLRGYGYWKMPANRTQGLITGQLTTWTHTETVYGSSGFGWVFVVSDGRGIVVHCEATLDGKVRASSQSHGPYGWVSCGV